MSAAGRYHAWATAAALSSAALMSVASESMSLALISVPAIAMSWMVFHRSGRTPIPRWIINCLLIALTLNLFRQVLSPDHRPEDSIAHLSQFLIGLMIIKLFEHRRARDQAQALALGAMAAIGAVMTSVTLGVAVWTAAYLASATCAVVLFQFVSGEAQARGADLLWDADDKRTPTREDRAWVTPVRWVLGGAAAAMILGGAVVFMVIPRDLGQQLIGAWPAKSGAATTGFSDEVQLGIDGVISESDDIVMEVILELGGKTMLVPASQYFRGAVLDHYDPERGVWRRSHRYSDRSNPGALAQDTRTEAERLRIRTEEEKRQIVQRVLLRNKTTEHLFALWKPVETSVYGGPRVFMSPIDSTVRLEGTRGAVRYVVVSSPGAAEQSVPNRDRSETFSSGPIRDYAAEVLRRRNLERDPDVVTSPADEQRVDVLRQNLSSVCRYSLELEAPPPGKDPIEWFLFESKQGTCEYFATALAAMCRSVGIEARVVTGFVTNEVDQSTGQYIVRSRNAHAWVEALVPVSNDAGTEGDAPVAVRWKTLDAVPSDSPETIGAASKIAAAVRRTIERLESLWLNAVISFDGQSQTDVLGPAMGPSGWIGSLGGRIMSVRGNWASRVVGTAAVFFGAFVAVSGGLMLARWAIRSRRRWGIRGTATHTRTLRDRAAHRMVARLDRVLRKGGIGRPSWAGMIEHSTSVAQVDAVAGALAERVARACYATRFGGAATAELEREHGTIDQIAARLRAHRRAARKAR